MVALAPSTKIDEIYYHMLVPSRIVIEGALHPYRQPWEGSILPQMVFQMAAAPLHALAIPDAANVLNWGLSATLVWLCWWLIGQQTQDFNWACLWAAALAIGMYPVVWHSTGSAQAMGDLATAACIVLLLDHESWLGKISLPTFAGMTSFLVLVSGSAKISMLPLGGLCLGFLGYLSFKDRRDSGHLCRILGAMLLPWGALVLPLWGWMFWQTQSPWGPIFAGQVPLPSPSPSSFLEATGHFLLGYSPLLWIGLGRGLFVGKNQLARYLALLVWGWQLLLLLLLLPKHPRFLGGIQYGLLIISGLAGQGRMFARATSKALGLAIAFWLLMPWLGLQLYYARPFFPVVLGWEHPSMFYRKYVAFYQDFQALDRLLAPEAVIFFQGVRPGLIYAPRLGLLDLTDLHRVSVAAALVLFLVDAPPEIPPTLTPAGYQLGSLLYENTAAVIQTYRTPGRSPDVGHLRVFQLLPLADAGSVSG